MRSAALAKLTALVAPPRCSACGVGCEAGRWICAECLGELHAMPRPAARDSAQAAFPYRGAAKELVLALKFGGAVALADEMASLMHERLGNAVEDCEVIVPAPPHPDRLRRRGYNQSRLLAEALAARRGAVMVDCLTRDASRPPQSELGRRERKALPAGAISLRRDFSGGFYAASASAFRTNVVVCDDVTTTGSTLEACTRAMRDRLPEPGGARLRAVVFAAA